MIRPEISQAIEQLRDRTLKGGGFALRSGEVFRPDATAWAVIGLSTLGREPELRAAVCGRLAAGQLKDGRVSISPDHPEAFWPTPLAVLAWQGAQTDKAAQERAVSFPLATSGLHWKKNPEAIFGHDSDLKGWPWLASTSSWAEPTALALMALQVAGYGSHPRVAEAVRLLLDRQIPGGGWNYGNTTVFGQTLQAMPEDTGMVLAALGPLISRPTA